MNQRREPIMKQITLLSLLISTLSATTIHVPADYSTIQAGINASNDGDTVLVAEGTYAENLILEKEIVLASHAIYDDLDSDWTINENVQGTIVNGGLNGSCLVIRYGNIQPTVIGFTFENGVGSSMFIDNGCSDTQERSGGAMVVYKAYPTVNYNRFMNNGLDTDSGQNTANGGAISHFADDDVEFDEDRNNASQNNNSSRDIPEEINFQNNFFENNTSGNGENIYSHGYEGDINVSGSVFENIDCEMSMVNDFVLRSIENEANYIQNDISGNCIEENAYYVSPMGDDGNSGTEAEPFRSILHALSLVKTNVDEVTTIHLGSGVYSSEATHDVFPIVLPDRVHLIGENMQTTILDADANQYNEAGLIVIKEVDDVYVANLTLRGGYTEESHGCTGGGALVITANDMDNLDWEMVSNEAVIENLIIENSHSHNGGGLSLFRVDGPTLNNVTVRNNTATMMGGGVNIYVSNSTMSNFEIHNNSCIGTYYQGIQDVGHGGGLFFNNSSGTYDQFHIYDNTASMNGGGVWSSEGSDWVMSNSLVEANVAPYFGGGFAFWNNDGPYLDGGVGLNAILQNVTISNNLAQPGWGGDGGGVWGSNSSTVFEDCIFIDNTANGNGGGVWGSNSSAVFEDCSFIDNTASGNGGGANYSGGGTPVFNNSIFERNSSIYYGGGIYIYFNADGFYVERCTFVDNSTGVNGGAIQTNKSGAVINSTFYGNTTGEYGAISIGTEGEWVDVYNSILWNDNISHEFGGFVGYFNVNHTDVQPSGNNQYDGYWTGNGNIVDNPLFTDAENGDFTLQSESPCIDAGTADVDGDGTDDINDYYGDAPDMGAFEFIVAVTNLEYTISNNSVILAWDIVEDATYYRVERSTDSEFETDVELNYSQSNTFTDDELDYNVTYYYRVAAYLGYWSDYSEVISVTIESVGLADDTQIPGTYNLHQNHPNPFNPTTTLRYDLPDDGMVNITIYDMMGRVVRNLVNDHQSAGYKTIQWNGTNGFGEPVAAGVYLYQIHAGNFQKTKKMILLK